jgi:hypothetical protein
LTQQDDSERIVHRDQKCRDVAILAALAFAGVAFA